jgi:acyl carrier protein phosphodiesterase
MDAEDAGAGERRGRMNLLAHAILSPAQPEIMVGNLTADWVKGKARHALPPQFRQGVELHRRIDGFTDAHPLVEHCTTMFDGRWGRYSPVLVDILFDHVLSVGWGRYSDVPRERFIEETYAALRAHLHVLPARAQYGANALLADDWFTCYATLDGIALSLSRLSKRLSHGVELAPAVQDFVEHQEPFTRAFHEFFPQLRKHVESGAGVRVD